MSNTTSTGGISDRLADEAKMGALDLANLPKLPSIPSAASDDVGALRRTITAMKMLLDVREGRAGSAMDKHLTLRDLLDAGLTSVSALGQVSGGTGTTINNTVTGGTGGSGAGYQDMRPVLGTPPTLTGLAAQGAFKNIVLTWVMPPYANHAYVEVWRNSVDVLGTAAVVGTTVDNLYVDASGSLGSSYFYWVRAYNIEGTAGAFNAVSGAPAGLLKIGSTDLGPLVVLAGNLADGSITAAKVLAGQLDATKFASSVEPITMVLTGSLPTVKSTTTIYYTPGGKLYKWNGTAYSGTLQDFGDLSGSLGNTQVIANTIGGDKIIANSIDAGKIVAASITATQLAAGAITTDKLVVTGKGAAINDDPMFQDPTAWTWYGGASAGSFATILDGVAGVGALRSVGSGGAWANSAKPFAFDRAKTYRVRGRVRCQLSPNGTMFLGVAAFDSAGANIVGDGSQWKYNAAYNVSAATVGTAWHTFTASFGAGTASDFPATARTICPLIILNYGGTTGYMEAQDLRIEEMADYSLIVDGAIIAGKIAVNAIVAGDGAIKNAAITNALIANLAVDDAKIASLNVNKVTAGTMDASFITAWTITADRMLTGILSADNVLTRNLTVRDASGNVLLSSGVNLPAANIAPAAGWLNSNIAISSGAISGIGSGSGTVVDNSLVTATAIGAVKTDASNAPGAILNSNVTLSASGVLSGGSGAVTVVGLDNSIVRSGFPINPGNVTTYISGAAIGLANINTASIGTLSALSADMGTVTAGTLTLNSSGHIKSGQTDFNTGTGFWLGLASGTPKFSIGNPSGENMVWDGAHLTLTDPTFQPFTASITGGDLTVSVWYGTQDYGSRKVEVSGGKAPYSYFWVVVNGAMTSSWKFYDSYLRVITELAISQVWPAGGSNAATVTLRGSGFTFTNRARVGCFVSDANGRVTFATFLLTATHADSPGGGGGGGGDGGAGP